MWTATITKKELNSFGQLDVTVDFTNSSSEEKHLAFPFHGIVDEDSLKQNIQNQLDFYTKTSQALQDIDLGVYVPTPIVAPTTPIITPEEQAFSDFLIAYRKLEAYNRAKVQGLVLDDYDTVLKEAQSKFLPEYVEKI